MSATAERPVLEEVLDLATGYDLVLRIGGATTRLPLAGALLVHRDGRHVGVVLAYCVLRAALADGAEAGAIAIESGHHGSGMEDAFEFFTRAVSGGRYRRVSPEAGCRVAGAPGVFWWRINGIALDLRDGVLDPALFAQSGDARERARRQRDSIRAMLVADDDALFVRAP